jgi:hypothetical protein
MISMQKPTHIYCQKKKNPHISTCKTYFPCHLKTHWGQFSSQWDPGSIWSYDS